MLLNEKQFLIDNLKTYLQEKSFIFAIENDKIYTDDRVRKSFKAIINRQDSIPKKYKVKINQLVDHNFIIPCYIHETALDAFEKSLFSEKKDYTRHDNTMGFYNTENKRIFMFLKHIEKIDFWGKNDLVSITMIHEFQHCFLNLFPNSFLNLHRQALDSYFSNVLKTYFNVQESTVKARTLYEYLIRSFDAPENPVDGDAAINEYMEVLQYIGVDKNKRNEFKNSIIGYLNNPQEYLLNIHKKKLPDYNLYKQLKLSYGRLGIVPNMIDSLCIQELIFSGEVICIESEFNRKDRHLSLLERIGVGR